MLNTREWECDATKWNKEGQFDRKNEPYSVSHNHSPHNVHVYAQFYWFDVLQARTYFCAMGKKCSKRMSNIRFVPRYIEWMSFVGAHHTHVFGFDIVSLVFFPPKTKGIVRHSRNSLRSWCQFHWKSKKNISSIFLCGFLAVNWQSSEREAIDSWVKSDRKCYVTCSFLRFEGAWS